MPVYYCVSYTRSDDIFQLKTLRPPSGQTFCKIMTIGRLSSQKVVFTGIKSHFSYTPKLFFYRTMHFDIYKVHLPTNALFIKLDRVLKFTLQITLACSYVFRSTTIIREPSLDPS